MSYISSMCLKSRYLKTVKKRKRFVDASSPIVRLAVCHYVTTNVCDLRLSVDPQSYHRDHQHRPHLFYHPSPPSPPSPNFLGASRIHKGFRGCRTATCLKHRQLKKRMAECPPPLWSHCLRSTKDLRVSDLRLGWVREGIGTMAR